MISRRMLATVLGGAALGLVLADPSLAQTATEAPAAETSETPAAETTETPAAETPEAAAAETTEAPAETAGSES